MYVISKGNKNCDKTLSKTWSCKCDRRKFQLQYALINIDPTIFTKMPQFKILFCCTTIPNQVHPIQPFKMKKRVQGKERKEGTDKFLDIEGIFFRWSKIRQLEG